MGVKVRPDGVTWARRAAGLTKAQLASLIGRSPSYVTMLEQGERGASEPTAKAIAEALGCPLTVIADLKVDG